MGRKERRSIHQRRDPLDASRITRHDRQRRALEIVDLPTGHWPMWSEPERLAQVVADAAQG